MLTGAAGRIGTAITPDLSRRWDLRLTDVEAGHGAYHVARAAAACGGRRLVLASSLHVVSAGPDETQVRASDPARPGSLYGATKAWAEAVGAWVAATTSTSVVALRIGYFSVEPPTQGSATSREQSAWLSPRDAAELVRAAVEAESLTFVMANGVSANRYRSADLSETVRQLGYQPSDDAWSP